MKGAISALASLQGHLLIASGPKIILHKWTGTELNGVAFFDAPPLYVVSLNIVCLIFSPSVSLLLGLLHLGAWIQSLTLCFQWPEFMMSANYVVLQCFDVPRCL